ncbi:response regulator [Massilia sp. PAMC28688]|uniref:response regulator n=1 Tax=Massilia sp. PAMC28688 TaxID=2861283 RepID=UPI001C633664|nr:response regulator [Massilia sp. PAMC28688]QYF94477.1 response regulator [Massilia sp. PAMC28688]
MHKRLILIVDDEADLRAMMQEIFELSGYLVVTTCHGREALDYLMGAPRPHLILLDLTMPVMGGLAFLEELHCGDYPHLTSIPVVVISAVEQFVDLERFGCAGTLIKPASLDDILSTAWRAMERA